MSGGSYHYSTSGAASATLKFTGDAFRVNYLQFFNFGLFDIYVDGQYLATIDGYHSGSRGEATPDYLLPPGEHTLLIQNTGLVNAAATDVIIALDAIDIRGEAILPPPPVEILSENRGEYLARCGWRRPGERGRYACCRHAD